MGAYRVARFTQLKERYDQVTAVSFFFTSCVPHERKNVLNVFQKREQFNKELAVAQDKLKKLENECKYVCVPPLFLLPISLTTAYTVCSWTRSISPRPHNPVSCTISNSTPSRCTTTSSPVALSPHLSRSRPTSKQRPGRSARRHGRQMAHQMVIRSMGG